MDARYDQDVYFGSKPIFGSAAPAFDIPETQEETRPRERVSIRSKAKAVSRQGVSLLAVAGWACVAVLAVALLLSYVELNIISNESHELSAELESLKIEEVRLMIDYESTFRLDEVEEYATNMLGMVKSDNGQVKYLDNRAEDQAVILNDTGANTGFSAALKSFFISIAEYFK